MSILTYPLGFIGGGADKFYNGVMENSLRFNDGDTPALIRTPASSDSERKKFTWACWVKKTISSAVANAENNYQYDIDNLIVKEAYCGKQVIMKRFRARAKGKAARIVKPYSNLTVILSEKKQKMESHGTKG